MDYDEGADCNENTVQDFSSTSISRDQVELALAGVVLVATIVVIAAPKVAAGLAALTAGAAAGVLGGGLAGLFLTAAGATGFTAAGATIAGVAAGVGLIAGGVLTVMNEVDDMNGW
jgi:hypothetical protein